MKISITVKDPDGFYDCVVESVMSEVHEIEGLSDEEKEDVADRRISDTWDKLSKWVEYREYLTVDFDLDTMTAVVKTRT